jgi:hypothetical protein
MNPVPDTDAANRGYGQVQDASQIPVSALVDVFGPEAYNVQPDRKRYSKDKRQHIPPNLLGPSEFITERVDGLITDATKSPFTTLILPYQYLEDPDRRIEWNVWRFDEGLASRVPYESSARTLSQSKETFSGYTVRQGKTCVVCLQMHAVCACVLPGTQLTPCAQVSRSRSSTTL